jgi:hypothetical protein
MATLAADRSTHLISKEHVMSPFTMIDLARAIEADRRRETRQAIRHFRRSA